VLRAAFRLLPYLLALWRAAGQAQVLHVMANSGWSWHLFAAPAIWVARWRGVPVVVNYRGGEAAGFLATSRRSVAWSLRHAAWLIVPSGFLQQVFGRHGLAAHIVPNVVDLQRFHPLAQVTGDAALRPREPQLMVSRNIEPIYDNGTALRAFALTCEADPAKAVKWIGHRTYEAEFGGSEAFVRPVVFRAGSLGGGLPQRDLKVSPQHGMLIDGVMVPAATLVNGVSIVRDETVGDTEYFHVELDGHEAIFAEGAAAETYIDLDSRAMFDNADEYGLLYGSAQPVDSAFERIEEGVRLAAIRARLAKLAGIELTASAGALSGRLESLTDGVLSGWVAGATGDAVEAEVLVDGERYSIIRARQTIEELVGADLVPEWL
jgi:hypothetical protein